MTIKLIPTWYKGCLFRSRLEARWAVFFDHLGIRWQWEAQGYEVEWRLKNGPHATCEDKLFCGYCCERPTFRYLPDFWLPDLELHAEVKGSLDWDGVDRLLNAAAFLSCGGANGCREQGDNEGNDVLLLGPIPDSTARLPMRLHMHNGWLKAYPHQLLGDEMDCSGYQFDYQYDILAHDNPAELGGMFDREYEIDISPFSDSVVWSTGRSRSRPERQRRLVRALLTGMPKPECSRGKELPWITSGYAAARSARFEYGESGSMLAGRVAQWKPPVTLRSASERAAMAWKPLPPTKYLPEQHCSLWDARSVHTHHSYERSPEEWRFCHGWNPQPGSCGYCGHRPTYHVNESTCVDSHTYGLHCDCHGFIPLPLPLQVST